MTSTPETFAKQQDALAWLHDYFGCPFPSAGKFSQDCRNGICLVQPNKTYRGKDVRAYAERIKFDKRTATLSESRSAEREELEIRKLKLDVEAKELANRREDDRYLLKDDAWLQMAALVGSLRDALRHQCHVAIPRLLTLAGNIDKECPHCKEEIKAESSRGPEVYEGLEEIIARAMNEVLESGRIEVVFESEDGEAQ